LDEEMLNIRMIDGAVVTAHAVVGESSLISCKFTTERAFVPINLHAGEVSLNTSAPGEWTCSRGGSPVPSVTGRTLTTFQTFRGDIQPIVWRDADKQV